MEAAALAAHFCSSFGCSHSTGHLRLNPLILIGQMPPGDITPLHSRFLISGVLGGDRFYKTTGVRRVGDRQVDIRHGRGWHGEAFVADYLGGGKINWIQIELDPNVIHIRQHWFVSG